MTPGRRGLRAPGIVLAAFTIMPLATACGETPAPPEPVARPVKMLEIGDAGSAGALEFPGEIRATQQAEMGFEVAGKLTEFPVQEGQAVTAGAVLARLDARDYQAKLAESQAKVNQAKTDVERFRYLVEQGVNAPRDLEMRERNLEVFNAEMAVARKAVEDTILRAPFDGRVGRKLVDDFANVQAKQAVLVLQNEDGLEIRVSVPERDLAGGSREGRDDLVATNERLQPTVTVSAIPDRAFPAALTELATSADPTTRTYQATFRFVAPPDVNVLPGMTGKVRVRSSRGGRAPDGIRVPVGAVSADESGDSFVWRIDTEAMTAHQQPVALGEMSGDSVAIESGLGGGDVIAVSGLRQLREGLPVRRYEERGE